MLDGTASSASSARRVSSSARVRTSAHAPEAETADTRRAAEDSGAQEPEEGPERPSRMRISGSASSFAVAISASSSF